MGMDGYMPHPPHTYPVPRPYKTNACLSKILVCWLDLDILLVALGYIVFKTPMGHFVINRQVPIC